MGRFGHGCRPCARMGATAEPRHAGVAWNEGIVTGHSTDNRAARVFDTIPDDMKGLLKAAEFVVDVQEVIFSYSCESLTAEQAMQQIIEALHA